MKLTIKTGKDRNYISKRYIRIKAKKVEAKDVKLLAKIVKTIETHEKESNNESKTN